VQQHPGRRQHHHSTYTKVVGRSQVGNIDVARAVHRHSTQCAEAIAAGGWARNVGEGVEQHTRRRQHYHSALSSVITRVLIGHVDVARAIHCHTSHLLKAVAAGGWIGGIGEGIEQHTGRRQHYHSSLSSVVARA
jgi:hypothetical protein